MNRRALQLPNGGEVGHADDPNDFVVAGTLCAGAHCADGRSRRKTGNSRMPPALAEDR